MAEKKLVEGLKYEQAFQELESIVDALDEEEHSLEQALALFERGQALVQRCAALLDNAELKVQELTEEGTIKPLE